MREVNEHYLKYLKTQDANKIERVVTQGIVKEVSAIQERNAAHNYQLKCKNKAKNKYHNEGDYDSQGANMSGKGLSDHAKSTSPQKGIIKPPAQQLRTLDTLTSTIEHQ